MCPPKTKGHTLPGRPHQTHHVPCGAAHIVSHHFKRTAKAQPCPREPHAAGVRVRREQQAFLASKVASCPKGSRSLPEVPDGNNPSGALLPGQLLAAPLEHPLLVRPTDHLPGVPSNIRQLHPGIQLVHKLQLRVRPQLPANLAGPIPHGRTRRSHDPPATSREDHGAGRS